MSAAREQIRVALEGQKEGFLRPEIFAKCAAGKGTIKSALQAMLKDGEVEGASGDSPHKTRYTLTGKKSARAAPPQQRRKLKRGGKRAAKRAPRAVGARKPANGAAFLPAITADNRLVLVAPKGPAHVYGVEDTKHIATLMLANFEPD